MDDDMHSLYAYAKANPLMLLVVVLGLVDDAFGLKQLSLVLDFQRMVAILNSYLWLQLYSLMNDLFEVVDVVVVVVVVADDDEFVH